MSRIILDKEILKATISSEPYLEKKFDEPDNADRAIAQAQREADIAFYTEVSNE